MSHRQDSPQPVQSLQTQEVLRELHEQGRGAARARAQEAQGVQGRLPDAHQLRVPALQALAAPLPRRPLAVRLRLHVPEERVPGAGARVAPLLAGTARRRLAVRAALLPLRRGPEPEPLPAAARARPRAAAEPAAAALRAALAADQLGDAAGDGGAAALHGGEVGQVSRPLPDPHLRGPGSTSPPLAESECARACAGAAAAGVLEGPVPAAPLPVVRRLGHLPPPHRPRRAALARRGGRGQGGPRDHFQVEHGTICTVQAI